MLVVRAASCVTSALAPVLVLDVFRLDVKSGVKAILVPGEDLLGFFPQFCSFDVVAICSFVAVAICYFVAVANILETGNSI